LPIACNRHTADLLISSPVLKEHEERKVYQSLAEKETA